MNKNVGYSAINTAKSAISSVCALVSGRDIGNEKIVKWFMKGIFTERPSLPRYGKIWDVNIVFTYLIALECNADMSLNKLSGKLAILLMLLSGQRCQTIHLLAIDDVEITNILVCKVAQLLKHSKPGTHQAPLEFQRYVANEKLCVVQTMQDYISRTAPIRGQEKQLFISTVPPHKAVSKSTIARWIKNVMENAGIDTSTFKAHSCRSASTSAASAKGLQLETIMKAAGWHSATTFQRYYGKAIERPSFCQSVLASRE